MVSIDEIKNIIRMEYPDVDIKKIERKDFIFEERVKQKCFHCKNYNLKWTCPPKRPNLDWSKIFDEYGNLAILICKVPLNGTNLKEQREFSTNRIHRALLYLETELYKRNNSLALSFIGGSCKLCKNGCNKERCVNPYLSRIPLEATGCNVVSTLKNIGIDVKFPVTDYLYRYGLFLW